MKIPGRQNVTCLACQDLKPSLVIYAALDDENVFPRPFSFCCYVHLTNVQKIKSLRYHLLHPDYLYFRIRELQKNFKLRVVLCHVDVEDVVKPLLEVTKTALLHDCTLLCAWSLEECGRYLETIKVYENKPADLIQGQMDMDYISRLNHALTSIRHVNKTDVVTLGSTFGSLSSIMDASMEDLARCPGIGERKVGNVFVAVPAQCWVQI
ncbi:DNA excision repair protein ERCC-1-like [Salvia miltiorrhiza]|uniref:DNA excision repair protein ERCC-1-like n=1 Tax=Salvia miltiorrhiza TaxID=226208 RepID=UPI0025AB7871|nr:DNA excision repair protein ERCC-1-like [Salvia miltiorrhiza]